MFNCNRATLSLVFVFSVGFISCGKNEPGAPASNVSPQNNSTGPRQPATNESTKTEAENADFFQMEAPRIVESWEPIDATGRDLRDFVVDPVQATSQILLFTLEKQKSHLPIRYSIESVCKYKNLTANQKYSGTAEVLEFSKILPLDLLFNRDRGTNEWSCLFNFSFADKVGSTHNYQISHILVANTHAIENIILRPTNRDGILAVESKSITDDKLDSIILHFNDMPTTEPALVCEHYTQRIPINLTSRPMSEWIFSQQTETIAAIRRKYPKQKCRILGDHDRGKLASSYFTLLFHTEGPRVWFEQFGREVKGLKQNMPLVVGTLHIFNPTNDIMPVGIELNQQASVSHTFVDQANLGSRSFPINRPLFIESDLNVDQVRDGYMIIWIPPRAGGKVTYFLRMQWECTPEGKRQVGGFVRFQSPIRLTTYFDSRTGKISDATIDQVIPYNDNQNWQFYPWLDDAAILNRDRLPTPSITWTEKGSCQ